MKKAINSALKITTLWCAAGLIISVLIQVYARFFLPVAPAWTEELSRLFFIYGMSSAAGLAYTTGEYVAMDILYQRLSEGSKHRLELLISICCSLLFLLMLYASIRLILLGLPERSPSMGMSMAISFSSMLLLSISLSYYSLIHLRSLINTRL